MPMRNGVIKKVAFYPRILVTKSFITEKVASSQVNLISDAIHSASDDLT